MKNGQAPESRSTPRRPVRCPKCSSYSASVVDITPPYARCRCEDCGTIYQFKLLKRLAGKIEATQREHFNQRPRGRKREFEKPAGIPGPCEGTITQFIEDAINRGPAGVRAAQREANRLSRKFGVTFEPKWFICTKWLKEWASGAFGTRANGLPLTNGPGQRGERDSRARVRAAIVWRSHWLCAYAMSGSKVMACRVARVGHSTADYHLKKDLDFAAQAESAKEQADDLLHTRCMQRCIEGDIEPVYWQGEVIGHIQKFDTRLQIEMLRAHMPDTFKTPGQGGNINTKDSNVLVMTEEMRAKLMAANRERIMALPDSFDMPAARVATLQESESHESQ